MPKNNLVTYLLCYVTACIVSRYFPRGRSVARQNLKGDFDFLELVKQLRNILQHGNFLNSKSTVGVIVKLRINWMYHRFHY